MIRNKIISAKRIPALRNALKKNRKKIAFTNGCFDILHAGHVSYLAKAKQTADVLFIGINTDASVRALKGKHRPLNPLKDRMSVLSGLECVDYICPFSEETPLKLITALKPDILAKGGDWKIKDIVGAPLVKSYGGKVVRIPFKKGYSTTSLIKKISSL